MQDVTLIGIDLGKHSFHVHGQDRHGKALLRKKFSRRQLIAFLANFPACTIVMEACAGAHWMARQLAGYRHEAKLISPQLQAIERSGSISGAAREMEMSYRRAWLLVEEMNRCFHRPLVATATGGASITELAREVLSCYQHLQKKADAAVEKDMLYLRSLIIDKN